MRTEPTLPAPMRSKSAGRRVELAADHAVELARGGRGRDPGRAQADQQGCAADQFAHRPVRDQAQERLLAAGDDLAVGGGRNGGRVSQSAIAVLAFLIALPAVAASSPQRRPSRPRSAAARSGRAACRTPPRRSPRRKPTPGQRRSCRWTRPRCSPSPRSPPLGWAPAAPAASELPAPVDPALLSEPSPPSPSWPPVALGAAGRYSLPAGAPIAGAASSKASEIAAAENAVRCRWKSVIEGVTPRR